MTLVTIPAHLPFLDILAAQWLAHFSHDKLATGNGTIVLPGRRAARTLTEAFLRQTNGQSILLPRIIPIGTLSDNEAEITLTQIPGTENVANVIDLPPAIDKMTRLATLTRIILAADSTFHNQTLEQAWFLAQSLADLMDEAERMDIDLHEQLPHAVQEDFAKHWQDTLHFLSIVTHHWPKWLCENGAMNPVARQVALVRKQAALWRQQAVQAPDHPIWAAGFTNTLSSTIEALSAILTHPQGHIIFPGLDITTSDEIFNALPDTHPQASMRDLLDALNVKRSDVTLWGSSAEISERTATLSQIMLPSKFWDRSTPRKLPGVSRIEVRNDQEEAMAISMLIRNALEIPHQKIALITPDRKIAQRVMSELERWGIRADDSAGILLSDTPTAVLLRLIIQAIDHHFAPVDLLALLKHPLVACGLDPKDCRQLARQLEQSALRGAAPPTDLCALKAIHSLKDRIQQNTREKNSLETLINRLEKCFAPIFHWQDSATHPIKIPVPELLTNLIQTAENLAQTNTAEAVSRLWQGEEGHRLSNLFSELIAATAILPAQPYTALNRLLNAVLRQDRTPIHRGDPSGVHPRVFIWELLETRLQTADIVILAGLSEGIWPPAADSGPWLNLAIREKIGLPSPEQKIGQAAHDFCMAVSAAQHVVLSSSNYREGQPVIPARWLTRAEIFLKIFLKDDQQPIPSHPAQEWVAQLALEQCQSQKQNCFKEPYPKPSLKQRPRQISITEVETWLRDPYAIYARHVLKLKPLPTLQEETDSKDFGNIIHKALERWIKDYDKTPESWHIEGARTCLETLFEEILEDKKYTHIGVSHRIWWKPRFQRIAQWVAEQATQNPPLDSLFAEVKGEMDIPDLPGGTFKLIGRADRIEYNADGFTILDYKTGDLPSKDDIKNSWAPQLFLEAAMLQKGAFKDIPEQHQVTDLIYWHLPSSPNKKMSSMSLKEKLDLSEKTNDLWEKFLSFIRYYDNPETPYCSHPYPGKEPRFAQYARLARVAEWRVPSVIENAENEE